ncbi:MAG: YgiT-type zinc finger protein [Elusimicrobiota bacterium]
MKCALCGGKIVEMTVTEEVIEANNHVVVNVKAEVCEQCHERYYASGVVNKLIELKEALRLHQLKLKEIGKVYRYRIG